MHVQYTPSIGQGAMERRRACASVTTTFSATRSLIMHMRSVLGIFVIVTRRAGVSSARMHTCKMDVILAVRGRGCKFCTLTICERKKIPQKQRQTSTVRRHNDMSCIFRAYPWRIYSGPPCVCVCVRVSVSLYGGLFIYYAYVGVWCLPCEVLAFVMNIFDRMCTDGESLTPFIV